QDFADPPAVDIVRSSTEVAPREQPAAGLSAEQRREIERGLEELNARLAKLRSNPAVKPDHLADAEIFFWILKFQNKLKTSPLSRPDFWQSRWLERSRQIGSSH